MPALDSEIWKLHTNTFEKGALRAAIAEHYADPDRLSLEQFLLYGGLFQGLMLGYASEALRCAEGNAGSLIWSYNDNWGEVGWSIIDYYCVRKIAYYFVKRALAHQAVAMREVDGRIRIYGFNDTPRPMKLKLECGYMAFDGTARKADTMILTVDAYSRTAVMTDLRPGDYDLTGGLLYAWPQDDTGIDPVRFGAGGFRHLRMPTPSLAVSDVVRCGNGVSFTVSSDCYAHGVHFGFPDDIRLTDAFFDLLPGQAKRITASINENAFREVMIHPRCIGD